MTNPPSDAAKAVEMARAALEDDAKATKGPWTTDAHDGWVDGWRIYGPSDARLFDEPMAGSESGSWSVADSKPDDIDFVIRARTREPLLATSLLSLAEENEMLKSGIIKDGKLRIDLPTTVFDSIEVYVDGKLVSGIRQSGPSPINSPGCMMARGESAPGEEK